MLKDMCAGMFKGCKGGRVGRWEDGRKERGVDVHFQVFQC